MPELKPGTRVWRRQPKQRALAVHHSDKPSSYLQGTALDRLCEGLPDDNLAKQLRAKASRAVTPNESYAKPNHIPVFAQFYRVRCRNCGETQTQFSHLFTRVTTDNITRELGYHDSLNRKPDGAYLTDTTEQFCPFCITKFTIR